MSTSTKYVGTCPVCERRHKVREGVMVHHGYQRPGWGSIVGDCFAVGMKPYEVSPEGCQAYLDSLQATLKSAYQALDTLKAAKKLTYVVKPWRKSDPSIPVELHEGDDYRFESLDRRNVRIPSFEEHQKALIAQDEQQIKHIGFEVTRITRLITSWKPAELTTVEDEDRAIKAEKKAKSDALKAERAAKRAEKEAKAAERLEKRLAKVRPFVEEAQRRLDEAKGTKAVQKAFLWVVTDGLPKTNQDLFWKLLDRDQLRRDAGLVLPWNGYLTDDRWNVQRIIDGTIGK